MSIFLLLPLFLGMAVVTQGALNRRISAELGLTWTVFLNASLFFLVSLALLLATKYVPQMLPEYLRVDQFSANKLKWWFLIPGFCGFFLVLGVPWSLQINGPSKTFILLIVAQILLSLVLDKFVFEATVSATKLAGAALALAGAILVAL